MYRHAGADMDLPALRNLKEPLANLNYALHLLTPKAPFSNPISFCCTHAREVGQLKH